MLSNSFHKIIVLGKEEEAIRTLVISDIHGCYDELQLLLTMTKYEPTDRLILLGDYVDRGQKSKEALNEAMTLRNLFGAIVLRGNHDQMMRNALEGREIPLWLNNGGYQTIISYVGQDWFTNGFDWDELEGALDYINIHAKDHLDFISSLPCYYEDDNHI